MNLSTMSFRDESGPRRWRRPPGSSSRNTTPGWETTSTPTRGCVRRSPSSPARSFATRLLGEENERAPFPVTKGGLGVLSRVVIKTTGREICETFPCLKDLPFLSDPSCSQTFVLPVFEYVMVHVLNLNSQFARRSLNCYWFLQVCDTFDEENPERSSQRNLHQAAGGGEGEEGQLRPRGQ